ncbi:hypothetical protein EIP91_010355 [Steccherinum ochraceum]|uniref:Protein-serine/threonine kinase n=1 Tax=Steccherinum ochraceum TaxID=92696 RepID=A0A4V2MUY1_9APHY|nr:hypothetical protein EIP91_010355 [Steccherinum ochraceum]
MNHTTSLWRPYLHSATRSTRHSRRQFHLGDIHSAVPDAPSPTEIAPLLEEFAKHSPRPLTLPKLFSFGQPLTAESILESASYVLSEAPRLFGSRVRNLEALPFIVGMNPFIARILAAHRKSFKTIAMFPPVTSLEENTRVTAQLEALVQAHANDIPTMAKGFQECSRYMTPEEISEFLDSAIRNRIAVRLIAEQHIALSRALQNGGKKVEEYIGVIHLACSPKQMIRMCGSFVSELCEATFGSAPKIIIDGDVDSTFVYVPVHLEYILTEILKNAFRASVERHHKQGYSSRHPIPPIYITISPPGSETPIASSAPSSSTAHPFISKHKQRPHFLSMRIRDEGGGVAESNINKIFSYSFTTAGRNSVSASMDDIDFSGSGGGGGPYAAQHIGGMAALDGSYGGGGGGLFGEMVGRGVQVGTGTIAGLGYGLPMSRLYAKYFGGSLDFISLDGWGSDVFLKLRCLDDAEDVVIG